MYLILREVVHNVISFTACLSYTLSSYLSIVIRLLKVLVNVMTSELHCSEYARPEGLKFGRLFLMLLCIHMQNIK